MQFDVTRKDNLVVYWGQDTSGNQQPLSYYCKDDTINVIPLGFLYKFSGQGGKPIISFSQGCNPSSSQIFAGTQLANCDSIAKDIKTCQAAGKIITLSLGGATGDVGFSSDSEAQSFADQIWNMFLGGNSDMRPFGDAVLDGVDLDIETGSAAHYAAFVSRIRSNGGNNSASPKTVAAGRRMALRGNNPSVTNKQKYYYITAAPQCPYPDRFIGDALNAAPFDAVYVQFYNNDCGLNHGSQFNLASWDNWAKSKSANPHVKVYIGAAASSNSSHDGYVDASTLANYVADAQKKYSSFGGVMLWDASTAYANNRYDKAIKSAMTKSS